MVLCSPPSKFFREWVVPPGPPLATPLIYKETPAQLIIQCNTPQHAPGSDQKRSGEDVVSCVLAVAACCIVWKHLPFIKALQRIYLQRFGERYIMRYHNNYSNRGRSETNRALCRILRVLDMCKIPHCFAEHLVERLFKSS